MAQEWTDGRLNDLSTRVDHGFEQVDQRFEQVDQRFERVDQRFEQIDQRFERVEKEIGNLRLETRAEFTALRGEMKEGFARMDQRLDSLQRTMIQGVIAMAAATLAGFSGIIVLIATQL